MRYKKGNVLILILGIITIVGIIGAGFSIWKNKTYPTSKTYKECTGAFGLRLLSRFPGVCTDHPDEKFTQPSNETTNWKTYKSKDNLYQISFPESWKVNDTNGVSISSENHINVSVLVHSDGSEEYVKERWQSVLCGGSNQNGNGCALISNKETKILTVNGNVIYWKIDGNGQMHAYIPNINKNKTVEIYSVSLKDKNIFDKILSTFKFLDSSGESNVKTDCDKKGGTLISNPRIPSGLEPCQIEYKDVDKACVDSSQCESQQCLSPDGRVPGKCSKYEIVFGCRSYVQNGKVVPPLCVD